MNRLFRHINNVKRQKGSNSLRANDLVSKIKCVRWVNSFNTCIIVHHTNYIHTHNIMVQEQK